MEKYNAYLEEVLNNTYKEVLPLVNDIKKIKCSSCGASSFANHICNYCGNTNKELETLLSKLNTKIIILEQNIKNLNIKTLPYNNLSNLLSNLNTESNTIKEFLATYKTPTLTSKDYQTLNSKLNTIKSLTLEEIKKLEHIIYHHDQNIDNTLICDYIILTCFFNHIPTINIKFSHPSLESFKETLKEFVKSQIRVYYPKYPLPECEIVSQNILNHQESLKGEVIGDSHYNQIRLSETILEAKKARHNLTLNF